MKKYAAVSILTVALVILSSKSFAAATLPSVGEIIQKCRDNYAKINDYTSILKRTEEINGSLRKHSDIIFKFKKPSYFYMMWPKYGFEAIYVEGKYDNKMKVKGKISFAEINLTEPPEIALKYNRHTIREANIGSILDIIEANYKKSINDKDSTIYLEDDVELDARKTILIKTVFPKNKDYYGHVVFIYIDKKLYLPVKFIVYGWNMELLEDYYYDQIKTNVGLKDDDFDTGSVHSTNKE